MKKRICLILAMLIFLTSGCGYPAFLREKITVTGEPVTIRATGDHPANNMQYNASVWMGVSGDKLYCMPYTYSSFRTMEYSEWLCVFEDGQIRKLLDLRKLSEWRILGSVGDTLYIASNTESAMKHSKLYAYDLKEETLTEVFSAEQFESPEYQYSYFARYSVFSSDGSVYFPFSPNGKYRIGYAHIFGTRLLEIFAQPEGIALGDSRYSVDRTSQDRLMRTHEDGTQEEVVLQRGQRKTLIPTEYGLLVHNERSVTGWDQLLYLVGEDGEVRELFSVEALDTTSAVTVYGPFVYISFMRYEEWGEIGMLPYENDTVRGTYRISLPDGKAEKISDGIYNGLFIFDDSGIYACDRHCDIYKLDWDGNVIETLMEVEQPSK